MVEITKAGCHKGIPLLDLVAPSKIEIKRLPNLPISQSPLSHSLWWAITFYLLRLCAGGENKMKAMRITARKMTRMFNHRVVDRAVADCRVTAVGPKPCT